MAAGPRNWPGVGDGKGPAPAELLAQQRSLSAPGAEVPCWPGHRRPARVDGLDDLLGVDALQVDRGHAEVAVPELALDDVQRYALAKQLQRMRVPQLVWSAAAAHAASRSSSPRSSDSWMRRPARQSTAISPRARCPCKPSPQARMTAMISSVRGGSGGYRRPLLGGRRPVR